MDDEEVLALELSLFTNEVRTNPDRLALVLHPDFVEFGASGREYRYRPGAAFGSVSVPARIEEGSIEFQRLSPQSLLLLYRAVQTDGSGAQKRSQRSSHWVRTPEGWRLRFHQGTPLD